MNGNIAGVDAFKKSYDNGSPYGFNGGSFPRNIPHIILDASSYNKTYGKRGEVSPNNYTMRLWVRVEEDEYVS